MQHLLADAGCLRRLAGDGALEPANAGLSKLGRATIERIELIDVDDLAVRVA